MNHITVKCPECDSRIELSCEAFRKRANQASTFKIQCPSCFASMPVDQLHKIIALSQFKENEDDWPIITKFRSKDE